jgi:Na+-translocating ferredoxin:NAD+ oxidoreductase RnfC subunit
MTDVILRIDATFGLKVKVGDKVRQGEELGTNADTGYLATCPISGIVKSVSFDPENHEFVVAVSSTK